MMRLNRKGFTLVEVLIVVAIIGLLAAIAIPNLMKARAGADIKVCKANQRAIKGAVTTYLVKEDVTLSGSEETLNSDNSFKSTSYDPIGLGYMKASDPFCPSDPYTTTTETIDDEDVTTTGGTGYTIVIDTNGHVTVSCGKDAHN